MACGLVVVCVVCVLNFINAVDVHYPTCKYSEGMLSTTTTLPWLRPLARPRPTKPTVPPKQPATQPATTTAMSPPIEPATPCEHTCIYIYNYSDTIYMCMYTHVWLHGTQQPCQQPLTQVGVTVLNYMGVILEIFENNELL